jgi:hypothetical protein
MDYALIMVFVACIAVGVVSAVAKTWAFHTRLYSLEDTVNVMQGNLQREVKIRAAQERWKKPSLDETLITSALENPPAPKSKQPWFRRPNLPKRSYAP